jgi:hypothetical protein
MARTMRYGFRKAAKDRQQDSCPAQLHTVAPESESMLRRQIPARCRYLFHRRQISELIKLFGSHFACMQVPAHNLALLCFVRACLPCHHTLMFLDAAPDVSWASVSLILPHLGFEVILGRH